MAPASYGAVSGRRRRFGVELGDDLGDLDLGRRDAVAAHPEQLRGPADAGGEHVDVDGVVLDLGEDRLELGEGVGVADLGSGALSHRGPP